MTDVNKLGRDFWTVMFSLEVATETLFTDDRIEEDFCEELSGDLGGVCDKLKELAGAIAAGSPEFVAGYRTADREAIEAGRQWSEARAEKIALLRLAGDDTPEDQIP